MNKLKANISANLLSQLLGVIAQLLTLPIYLSILGIESFGVIGFYVTLQVTIQAFDFGLGMTVNREMSKYNAGEITNQKALNTVATLESAFIILIIFLMSIIYFLMPLIYSHVITVENLSLESLVKSLNLITVLIAISWLSNIYQNGLMGLEKQVLVNKMRVFFIILNPIFTLSALHFHLPNLETFFFVQIILIALYTFMVRFLFFKSLKTEKGLKPAYDFQIIKNLRNYMAGSGAITAAGALCVVGDRWILINAVTLKEFAHYTLALTLSNSLYNIIAPVFTSFFPRFTSLISEKKTDELKSLYSIANEAMAVVVFSLAINFSFYSYFIFLFWLKDANLAKEISPIASLLVIGTAMNGLMNLPFAMQMSYGWVKLGFIITITSLLLFIPMAYLLASEWGPIGCAAAWLILNMTYFFIGGFIINKKLQDYIPETYFLRLLVPICIVSSAIAFSFYNFMPKDLSIFLSILYMGCSFSLSVLASLAITKHLKVFIIEKILSSIPERWKI